MSTAVIGFVCGFVGVVLGFAVGRAQGFREAVVALSQVGAEMIQRVAPKDVSPTPTQAKQAPRKNSFN